MITMQVPGDSPLALYAGQRVRLAVVLDAIGLAGSGRVVYADKQRDESWLTYRQRRRGRT